MSTDRESGRGNKRARVTRGSALKTHNCIANNISLPAGQLWSVDFCLAKKIPI
jgi:hypothetical protein